MKNFSIYIYPFFDKLRLFFKKFKLKHLIIIFYFLLLF